VVDDLVRDDTDLGLVLVVDYHGDDCTPSYIGQWIVVEEPMRRRGCEGGTSGEARVRRRWH
jgi:hypothetical protein